MKKQLWNKVTSVALSLAMAVTMLPTTPVGAATDVSTKTNVLSWVGEIAYDKDTGNTKATTTSVSVGLTVDATTSAWRTAITADTSNMKSPKVQINRTKEVSWDTCNFCFMDANWTVLAGSKGGEAVPDTSLEMDMPVAEEATVYAYVLDETITSIYVWDDAEAEEAAESARVAGTAFLNVFNTDWGTPAGKFVDADILGNGTYTVSFEADEAFNMGDFSALDIVEGESVLGRQAVVTVDEIKINGEAVELAADSYTCSADGAGVTTRVNISNPWNTPDFVTVADDGYVDNRVANEELQATAGATLLSDDDKKDIKSIEVKFTVSGADDSGIAFLNVFNTSWGAPAGKAKKAKVAGNGTYTVSLDADEAFDMGDFSALDIVNGELLFGREYVVTVDEIKINGEAVELAADSYTCSADGAAVTTRVNISNPWNTPDFVTVATDGYVDNRVANEELQATAGATLLSADDKKDIKSIEVTFTISGLDDSGVAHLNINKGDWSAYSATYQDARITRNGSYKVSMVADEAIDMGQFNALDIKNGEVLFGNTYTVTIDSIIINGKKVELEGNSYTCSADGAGVTTRVNLYNEWNNPNFEADEEGFCDNRVAKAELQENATARILNADDLVGVKSIEVAFTVENAKFEGAKYLVTVETTDGGNASASVNAAEEGEEVTLSAVPFSGYEFKEWVSDQVEVVDNKFTMPAKNVTVKAVFAEKQDEEVKPGDDSELKETAFEPVKITASSDYVIKSTDYPKNPVKLDLDVQFSDKFWNDWCPCYFKVNYDGKVKYYLLAGDQVTWNVTVGLVSDAEDSDAYIIPVSGSWSEAKGEICVDNYEIIKLPAVDTYYVKDGDGKQVYDDNNNPVLTDDAFKYSLTIKEIAGCDDWSVEVFCPAWAADNTQTKDDIDGTTKDLMKELTDEYDEDGNKTGNMVPIITDEADAYVFILSGKVTTSSKAVEKVEEPDVAGPAKGKKLSDKKYKYVVVTPGKTDGSLDGTVQVIGLKKKSLKTIKIASSVKIGGVKYNVVSIKKNAFKKNKKVTSVKIGKNVVTIGANAFAKMKKLKKVAINSTKLTTIGNGAFSGDKKLTSVVIKSMKLKKIGKKAFYGDKKLKTVKISSRILKTVGKKAFAKTKKKATFKVPSLKIADYKKKIKKAGAKKAKVKAL